MFNNLSQLAQIEIQQIFNKNMDIDTCKKIKKEVKDQVVKELKLASNHACFMKYEITKSYLKILEKACKKHLGRKFYIEEYKRFFDIEDFLKEKL